MVFCIDFLWGCDPGRLKKHTKDLTLLPTGDGLHPRSDGLQPRSDGLHPSTKRKRLLHLCVRRNDVHERFAKLGRGAAVRLELRPWRWVRRTISASGRFAMCFGRNNCQPWRTASLLDQPFGRLTMASALLADGRCLPKHQSGVRPTRRFPRSSAFWTCWQKHMDP